MSAINGDKSRHSINRKRGVQRRAKIRKMMEDRKSNKAPATSAAKTAK